MGSSSACLLFASGAPRLSDADGGVRCIAELSHLEMQFGSDSAFSMFLRDSLSILGNSLNSLTQTTASSQLERVFRLLTGRH